MESGKLRKLISMLKALELDIADQTILESIHHFFQSHSSEDDQLYHEWKQLSERIEIKLLTTFTVSLERSLGQSINDGIYQIKTEDRSQSLSSNELVVVLSNIRSAFNIGSILRTADCLGIKRVFLSGYTAGIDHPSVKKSSLGAEKNIEIISNISYPKTISLLKAEGYTCCALETCEESKSVFEYDMPVKTALILGNERYGLDKNELGLCDKIIEIPCIGIKNSLNVSNAFSIVGYHHFFLNKFTANS